MSTTTCLAVSYDARAALYRVCPEMRKLSQNLNICLEAIGKELSRREWEGVDTSYARAALLETRWRTNATCDVAEAESGFARLQAAMRRPDPPGALVQDERGGFAPGAEPWFLKLDRSTDQLLARQWPFKLPPVFLEEIDDPLRMTGYLEDLAWCDVARYLPHLVSNWNLLVDTLLASGTRRYPEGWCNADGSQSDHNNYDVAEIFRRAWRFMKPSQRVQASDLFSGMVRWCLGSSVTTDGEVLHPDSGDMMPDSYYFAAAFLDTVGMFDRTGCFWTSCDPWPAGWTADHLQAGMAKRLAVFHPHLTVVSDALERLHLRGRVHSSAVL